MVLIMTFGRTNHDEHCRFIPVYFMASSFLTASWPSLSRSLGLPLCTLESLETMEEHFDLPVRPQTCAPMAAEVPRGRDTAEPLRRPMDLFPESLKAQDRRMDAFPPPPSQSPLKNELISRRKVLRSVPAANVSDLLLHMGPSSHYSRGSARTGSISLDSRASLPSEMSDDVRLLFQPVIDERGPPAVPPRTTSRRADIEALGRTDDFHREAHLRPPQPRVRKTRPS